MRNKVIAAENNRLSWGETIGFALQTGRRTLVVDSGARSIPVEAWGPPPEAILARSALLAELMQGNMSEEGANLLSAELGWQGERQPAVSRADAQYMLKLGAAFIRVVRANMVVYGWETPFDQTDLIPAQTITNLAKFNPAPLSNISSDL